MCVIAGVGIVAVLAAGCGADDDGGGSNGGGGGNGGGGVEASAEPEGESLALDTRVEETEVLDMTGEGALPAEVQPESLVRGESADLDDIGSAVADDLSGHVPYYLTFSFTATEEDIGMASPGIQLQLVADGAFLAESVDLIHEPEGDQIEGCPPPAPSDMATGETETICQVYALPPESDPVMVSFSDAGLNPLLWEVEDGSFGDDWLEPGESTDIEWTDEAGSGSTPLHVETMELAPGEPDDLEPHGIELEDRQPYLATVEIRNDGAEEIMPTFVFHLSVQTASGYMAERRQGRDTEPGAACPGRGIDTVAPGETVEVCGLYAVPDGDEPVALILDPTNEGEEPDADMGNATIWHAPSTS